MARDRKIPKDYNKINAVQVELQSAGNNGIYAANTGHNDPPKTPMPELPGKGETRSMERIRIKRRIKNEAHATGKAVPVEISFSKGYYFKRKRKRKQLMKMVQRTNQATFVAGKKQGKK